MNVADPRKAVHAGWDAETTFGFAQAVRVGDTIYISGQAGLDGEGGLVATAASGGDGGPAIESAMAAQMAAAYAWAVRALAGFEADLSDVVQEVLYVLDVPAAFAVGGDVRRTAYGVERPEVASSLIGVAGLAVPGQLVEITMVAYKPAPA